MFNILLKIKNITKYYISKESKKTIKIEALKGVYLDVYKGEILGLLGQNGAGKSTLASIIATLHPATSGDIIFQDESIYNNFDNILRFRRILGYCPQKANFEPDLTIEENLIFAGRYFNLDKNFIKERVSFLLNKFDLYKYKDSKPNILSGGYKQRLLIARALIHEPKLIILDEPTVAMDPGIRKALWQDIIDLKSQGITVLLITHYLDEAEALSDRVCIMDNGLIKFIGTTKELKESFGQGKFEDIFLELLKAQD